MIENGTYEKLAKANAQAINGLQPKITVWNTGEGSSSSNDGTGAIRNIMQVSLLLLFATVNYWFPQFKMLVLRSAAQESSANRDTRGSLCLRYFRLSTTKPELHRRAGLLRWGLRGKARRSNRPGKAVRSTVLIMIRCGRLPRSAAPWCQGMETEGFKLLNQIVASTTVVFLQYGLTTSLFGGALGIDCSVSGWRW